MSKHTNMNPTKQDTDKNSPLRLLLSFGFCVVFLCMPFIHPITFLALIPAVSLCFALVSLGKILVAAYKYANRNRRPQYNGTVVDFEVKKTYSNGRSRYIYFPIIEYQRGDTEIKYTSQERENIVKLYEQRTVYENPDGTAFSVRELRSAALLQTIFFSCCFGLFALFIELLAGMDWSSLPATTMPDFLVEKWLHQILGAYKNLKDFVDSHIYSVDDLDFLIPAVFLGLLLSGFPCCAIYNWRLVQKSDRARRDGVTIKAKCKRTAYMKKSYAAVSQYEFKYNNQTKNYMSRGSDETLTLYYDPKTDKIYDEDSTNLAIVYIILSLMAFIALGWFYIKLWALWL